MALALPEAVPDWVGTSEAARYLKVSPRRVRALAEAGVLRSRRAGGRVQIARDSIGERRRAGLRAVRPLSPHGLELLIAALDERLGSTSPTDLSRADAPDRHRARQRVDRLLEDPQPAQLLRSWVRGQAPPTADVWPVDDKGAARAAGLDNAHAVVCLASNPGPREDHAVKVILQDSE